MCVFKRLFSECVLLSFIAAEFLNFAKSLALGSELSLQRFYRSLEFCLPPHNCFNKDNIFAQFSSLSGYVTGEISNSRGSSDKLEDRKFNSRAWPFKRYLALSDV